MPRKNFRVLSTVLLAASVVLAATTGTDAVARPSAGQRQQIKAEWNTDWAAAAYTADDGAATSSGSSGGDTGAGAAFDGNAGTHWSDSADDAWVAIDLGKSLRITGVQLDWEAAYGKEYAVEVSSDGRKWSSFFTENDGAGKSVTVHTYPQEVRGRYVRMRGIKPAASGGGYALSAFQVFGGEPAPASTTRGNLALFHPAYSNYYQDAGHSPSYVTDGGAPENLTDDSTRWSTDWNKDRWIAVDLGAASTIDTVDLYWQAAYAVDYRIQVSDDNKDWTTVYQPSQAEVEKRRADVASPTDAKGLRDTVKLDQPAKGRYVRMLGVERRKFYNPAPATAEFGYSLYEFQVWGTGGSADAAYADLPEDPGGTYSTVFSDEFEGSALDRDKWRVVKTGDTMGSVNGESQAYVDDPEAIATSDGTLKLKAKYCKGCTTTPDGGKFDFTSGRIDTHTKLDFTYGKVSARMKLPVGDGFWPAFWLLGSNVDDPAVSWPSGGETDIMENVGYQDWTSASLHGPGYSAEGNIGTTHDLPAGQSVADWHTYSVEWTPEAIRFYVDDERIQELSRQEVESTRGQWVYDHDQYVILNLALGGAYPAGWNKVTEPYWGLPQSSVDKIAAGGVQAEVDWVKVEQKK